MHSLELVSYCLFVAVVNQNSLLLSTKVVLIAFVPPDSFLLLWNS